MRKTPVTIMATVLAAGGLLTVVDVGAAGAARPAAALGATAVAAETTNAVDTATTKYKVNGKSPYGTTRNILPPGSSGNVDAAQLASLGTKDTTGSGVGLLTGLSTDSTSVRQATATDPTNFANQLYMYAGLNSAKPSSITDKSLTKYYKNAPLGVAKSDVVRTETPEPGLTIEWDKFGVPHIFAKTHAELGYGAGIADMEDRMFLTDVLRHTGDGQMAEFVGPTDSDISQDAAQLEVAPYDTQQVTHQIYAIAHKDPKEGKPLLATVKAYVAGINYEQKQLCPFSSMETLPGDLGQGFGVNCPVEYAAIGRPPQPYTLADVVSIASLIGGVFGTGGGGQYTNAIFLEQLQHKFGHKKGLAMFQDFLEKNDPEAPTTSPVRDNYEDGKVNQNAPGVAMPDLHPKETALATGAIVGSNGSLTAAPSGAAGDQGDASTSGPKPTPSKKDTTTTTTNRLGDNPAIEASDIDSELQRGLQGQMTGMSNELMVSGKHSKSGHPIAVFGPQTGYYAPQLLMEEDLEGPGVQARGVSFAGTNFVVELGHGLDYAWSATSPYTDITDTVVQKLCVPGHPGEKPPIDSTNYINLKGKCVGMYVGYDDETGLPSLAAQAAPKSVKFLILRTDQGIVELRTTVKGKPVAIVTDRSTYGHDADSVLGFYLLDNPNVVKSPKGFDKAVSKIDFCFNWFYIDSKNIAYFSSALLPKRAKGTDLDLPRWGTKKYAWRGFEPNSKHPQVVNPKRGFIVNWNNKLAPGFSSSSENWGDGSVYRSLVLQDRLVKDIKSKHKLTRAKVVQAMIGGATVDVPGRFDLPYVLKVIGKKSTGSAADNEAMSLFRKWVGAGSHRRAIQGGTTYLHQQAIDLFDTWWDPSNSTAGCPSSGCTFSLPEDMLRGRLGNYVDAIPEPLEDPPTEGIGSAYNGISWYGYVNKDLRTILGDKVKGKYSHVYCGNGSLKKCRASLIASLTKAVKDATGSSTPTAADVRGLKYAASRDDIAAFTAGVTGVEDIPWQNRPTFQQVVQYFRHRK